LVDKNKAHQIRIPDKEKNESIVRREFQPPSDAQVPGSIQDIQVTFVIDTGAQRTLISKKIFDRIDSSTRPPLGKKIKLTHAGGDALTNYGRCILTLKIGPLTITKEVIIADIPDDCLLGMDILRDPGGKSADIILSQGKIILHGIEIPLLHKFKVRKVRAADHVVIAPFSEMIIDTLVDRRDDDDSKPTCDVMIEPTTNFQEIYPLVMAPSLADLNRDVTAKIRIMNPFPDPVSIKQDAVIGQAEDLDKDSIACTILQQEDESNPENLNRVRRISIDTVPRKNVEDVIHVKIRRGKELDNKQKSQLRDLDAKIPEHLKNLFESAAKGKTLDVQISLAELLIQHGTTFSRDENDIGKTHLAEYSIDTGNTAPIKQSFRRTPAAFAGEEKKSIDKLKAQGVIRESTSPWSSPLVLVRKKTGGVRATIDYRLLNIHCRDFAFPIPKIQDCLDAIAGSKCFSTLDLTSGYHQIPVREEDIPKTAFISKHGLFEFTTMPMGLKTAGATFQRVMELALKGLQWTCCILYIDDLVIPATDEVENIQRLKLVLDRLKAANLKLQPKKCQLLKSEVTFLGHKVSGEGVRPDPNNVAKVLQWKEPENAKEVKQFLGMCSYYRRFIKDFSKTAKPLFDLTKDESNLIWTEDCQIAFNRLKGALTGPQIMATPIDGGNYVLDTDASDSAIGAVLSQIQNGQEKVISYASRTMSKSEKNYCVTDKELLSVRYFVEYFHHYLMGRKFIIRSDHQALKWLVSFKEPKGRVARWIEILSAYDYEIQFRKGTQHGNADSLSRCPNPTDCDCAENDSGNNLKCGPCGKCEKKAEEMQSTFVFGRNDHTVSTLRRITGKEIGSRLKSIVLMMTLLLQIVLVPSTYLSQTTAIMGSAQEYICKIYVKIFRVVKKMKFTLSRGLRIDWADGRLTAWTRRIGDLCRKISTRSDRNFEDEWSPWLPARSQGELRSKQRSDEDLKPIFKWMERGKPPPREEACTTSPATRHYLLFWSNLIVKNGMLFRKYTAKNRDEVLQFVVPRSMRNEILYQVHNAVMSGHLGRKKTKGKLLSKFYWFKAREDVNNWIIQCDVCGANKSPPKIPRAPLGDMRVGAPLDRIATDFVGPLPRTPRGNRYLLVVTDSFSKWVEIFAVPDQTAETTARVILNEVIARYGCPLYLHTDQGRSYESTIFRELCSLMEIKKTRTSPYNPRCNGQTENFNKVLIRMIRAYLKGEQTDWDLNLGCLASAYRSTPQESTGFTPNLLMLGREVRIPAEISFGSGTTLIGETVSSYGEHVENMKQKMEKAHDIARENLKASATRHKQIYDVKQSLHLYKSGDLVWHLQLGRREGVCPKLQMPYDGPAVIIQTLNTLDYIIQVDGSGKRKLVHHNKLKPYSSNFRPKWVQREIKKLRV